MPNVSEAAEKFWATVADRSATNEADVETWFVLPLLEALGYDRLDIASKVAIFFHEGRQKHPGRKPEADFVVYADRPFCRSTSLVVVESKRASEGLEGGKEQGESYAFNLRAPVLLLTNGRQLEIWQLRPTLESECVLACEVARLHEHRGQLEGLLSAEALKNYCKGLEHKNFGLLTRDLSAYEQAVYERVKLVAAGAIPRQLETSDQLRTLQSQELLDISGRGAVITAPSGYGKTILASLLMYESIERRWDGSLEALPLDLYLPDYIQSEQSLDVFLAERVSAHKPGFTVAQLRDIARDKGLVIIADGFERVEVVKRPLVEARLRTLLVDYPRARVYVMSRAQSAPTQLALTSLKLLGYQPRELRVLAELRSHVTPEASFAFSGAPGYVYRLGEIPLIADQLLNQYVATGLYPNNLSALFERWLVKILDASEVIDRALDRILLTNFAAATVFRPLNVTQAYELAANRKDPKGTLQRLVDQDAIVVLGTTVELQHEALADYLRAVQFWSSTPLLDRTFLDKLTFDPSSLYTFLLVSTAPTADARGAMWEAIARKNIQSAIRSLRFAGYDIPFSGAITESDGKQLAGDIQSTIETLITAHLEPVSAALRERIAGQPVQKLAVAANIWDDDIGYAFFDNIDLGGPVVLVERGEWKRAPRIYSRALRRMGFGPEAGRVLGVELIKNGIEELIRDRCFSGGRVWIEERAFGRLRHLVDRYEFMLDPADFAQSSTFLEEYRGKRVNGNRFGDEPSFAIDDLLDDLRWLREQGITKFDCWWSDLDSLNLKKPEDRQFFSQTLDLYHRRLQLAYDEILTTSFPALYPYLPTARLMPMRMEIFVERGSRHSREYVGLHTLRWPVHSFDEIGADVSFNDERPDYYNEEAMQRYSDRTDALLVKFGRFFPDRVIEWSSGRVPDFKGQDATFGKLSDESAVVSGVMAWLHEDLKRLFDELPTGRWQQ